MKPKLALMAAGACLAGYVAVNARGALGIALFVGAMFFAGCSVMLRK